MHSYRAKTTQDVDQLTQTLKSSIYPQFLNFRCVSPSQQAALLSQISHLTLVFSPPKFSFKLQQFSYQTLSF